MHSSWEVLIQEVHHEVEVVLEDVEVHQVVEELEDVVRLEVHHELLLHVAGLALHPSRPNHPEVLSECTGGSPACMELLVLVLHHQAS